LISPSDAAAGRSLFGDAILLTFVLVQALDGAFTYLGIATFGAVAEANPVVAWTVSVLGLGAGIATAKTFAVVCAAALHANHRHRILGGLTVLYLAAAVLPWTRILWL